MRKPWALVVLTLCLSSLFLPACSRKQPPPAAPAAPAAPGLPRPAYAGSQACAGCHKKRFEDFAKTAHFLTSQEGRADTIHGSFEEGHNVLKTSNPRLWF